MKKWFDPFLSAWVGVVTHKLRSFLTILGIVIGVAAVIALMSIGKGATQDIMSRISTLGSDLITISPGSFSFGGARGAGGASQTLTLEDAAAIQTEVPYIKEVAPTYGTGLQLIAGANNMRAQVTGVTPEYFDIYKLNVVDGVSISDYDYQMGDRVAVIGSGVKDTLFPDSEPVGQIMRMGTTIVRVAGVLESTQRIMMMGVNDNAVLVPFTALQQTVAQAKTSRGEHIVNSIALTVTDTKQTQVVTDDITALLRERHQLVEGADDDFRITSVEQIASTIQQATGTMTLLLGAIAAISLLVGGIGVMNIMLVSVLERTREIGILKALGAKERDIWGQFLAEAAFLTLVGGIIGVIVGWAVSYFVARSGTMSTLVTPDIVILAVSVSVGIGLFFGFYPAWNASRLNPIEALRSE
jgi:putative ABC transport system permease protein